MAAHARRKWWWTVIRGDCQNRSLVQRRRLHCALFPGWKRDQVVLAQELARALRRFGVGLAHCLRSWWMVQIELRQDTNPVIGAVDELRTATQLFGKPVVLRLAAL